ncbi:MAG TPA: VOC family protein [Saprospiraceae bacterium]|nr:VOC family protein [Saprospiraceae bacterium]
MAKNPFTWVEIYVSDMARAQKFYEEVLQIKMVELPLPESVEGVEMMSFPWDDKGPNISGALVKSSFMSPGAGGSMVYFTCDDCAIEISRVEKAGGKVVQEKFSIGNYGFCGFGTDTEGNIIGFHSMH